ncbi:MFS transporter [Rhodococcus sp. NPDC058481]|uniref:MFS transporter n=1 Tax=unclassified Rhodococcus (in: high G+C Gram-positive bacteria) TaxID=192944 RepID=UPI0036550801
MTRQLRALLAVLCAVSVANIYYAQPLLERIGSDLAMPTARLGLIVTVAQVGYLVGLIVLVPLGDAVDRRRLIAAGIAAASAGTLLVAFSATSAQLFIGVAVAGMFSVVVQVVVAYAAAVSAPAERGRNLGVITGGVVVGIIAARSVSGLVADVAGWRAVYACSAILSLLLACAAMVMLPQEHGARPPAPYLRAVAAVVTLTTTSRVFRTKALIALFLFASFGVLWSAMALPLGAAPWHLSPTQIGLFGIAGLAGALGAARAGTWADRGRGERVTVVALVLLLLSWVPIAQTAYSLIALVIGVVVLDFAVQAVHVSNQNRIVADDPEASSRIIGSYMAFYSVGSGVGAITATSVYGAVGWRAVSLLGAAYAAAALGVWALDRSILGRAERSVTDSPRERRTAPSESLRWRRS